MVKGRKRDTRFTQFVVRMVAEQVCVVEGRRGKNAITLSRKMGVKFLLGGEK
jgi:hypothetical protein